MRKHLLILALAAAWAMPTAALAEDPASAPKPGLYRQTVRILEATPSVGARCYDEAGTVFEQMAVNPGPGQPGAKTIRALNVEGTLVNVIATLPPSPPGFGTPWSGTASVEVRPGPVRYPQNFNVTATQTDANSYVASGTAISPAFGGEGTCTTRFQLNALRTGD